VVVTRNRSDVLRETLQAIRAQEWAPASVLVVDNDSDDGTAAMLAAEFPEVGYYRLPENLGFGAGLAAGMRRAGGGCDYFWLLDDDSRPAPITLRRCLGVARTMPRFGIIGLSGGTIRWGRLDVHPYIPTPDGRPTDPPLLNHSDFVHLDGAVVAREAVEHLGYPRADYFMMLEDVEYSNRLKRAGWEVAHFELDEDLIFRGTSARAATAGRAPLAGLLPDPQPPADGHRPPLAARGRRLALPAAQVHRRRPLPRPQGRADRPASAGRLARHAPGQRAHHRASPLIAVRRCRTYRVVPLRADAHGPARRILRD
jgi:hypothetical protein